MTEHSLRETGTKWNAISEPDGKYLDHFTTASGKAEDLVQELYDVLAESDSLASLQAIGSDGTTVEQSDCWN